MTQRFTVELERMNYYTATVEVLADDLSQAKQKALEKARTTRGLWEADIGDPRVTRVHAHAKPKASPE